MESYCADPVFPDTLAYWLPPAAAVPFVPLGGGAFGHGGELPADEVRQPEVVHLAGTDTGKYALTGTSTL